MVQQRNVVVQSRTTRGQENFRKMIRRHGRETGQRQALFVFRGWGRPCSWPGPGLAINLCAGIGSPRLWANIRRPCARALPLSSLRPATGLRFSATSMSENMSSSGIGFSNSSGAKGTWYGRYPDNQGCLSAPVAVMRWGGSKTRNFPIKSTASLKR